MRQLLICLAVSGLLSGSTAQAQQFGCTPAAEQQLRQRTQLYDLFQRIGRADLTNDVVRLDSKALDEFLALYRTSKLGNLHYLSSALTRLALEFFERGDSGEAEQALTGALELWPQNLDAYRLRQRIYLLQGPAGWPLAALDWGQEIWFGFSDLTRSYFELHRIFCWAVFALCGAVFCWIAAWWLAYHRLLSHDLFERIEGLHPAISLLLTTALPLLPLIEGKVLWVFLVLLFLLFPYGHRIEKILIFFLGGLLLVTPSLIQGASAVANVQKKPIARVLLHFGEGREWGQSVWKTLNQLASEEPEEPLVHFILGNLYYRNQCYFQAADAYRQVLKINPRHAQALNNLGNTLYQQGNRDGAIVLYRDAVEASPDLASAHLNLNLAYNEKFEFDAAEKSLERAKRLAPDLVRSQTEFEDPEENGQEAVISEAVDIHAELFKLVRQALSEPSPPLFEDLWPSRLLGTTLNELPFLGMVFLGALLLRWFLPFSHQTRYCIKCARATFPKSRSEKEHLQYCAQCLHVFLLGRGIDTDVQRQHVVYVNRESRKAKTRAQFYSWLLPGTGHLLGERSTLGIALLSLWGAAWALYFSPRLLVFSYLSVYDSGPAILAHAPLAVAGFVWLFANVFTSQEN